MHWDSCWNDYSFEPSFLPTTMIDINVILYPIKSNRTFGKVDSMYI